MDVTSSKATTKLRTWSSKEVSVKYISKILNGGYLIKDNNITENMASKEVSVK